MSSSEITLPSEVSGFIAPIAIPPEASRLNQMLKNTVNRCHATPMVRLSEITIIHVKEIRIFSIATT